jgi:multidrug transporter EmrE-like cation transporter
MPPLSSIILLLASSSTACLSMALFRHVLHGRIAWRGSLPLLVKETFALLAEPLFLLGLLAFATGTALWLVVLATQKLSVAFPVQIGLVTLFTGLISVLVFQEVIPLRGYVGYAMLLGGVMLIFR